MVTAGQQNRVFLRIPVKIPAAVYLNGQFYKATKLVDLSTNGLACLVSPSDPLPDNFEIRFRLTLFSRVIKIMLEVKNRVILSGSMRLGCIFLSISDLDKKRIDKYVCNSSGIFLPEQVVNFAAFFCAVDACLRSLLYNASSYYSATDFGRSVRDPVFSDPSGAMLIFYVFSAFSAFILSSPSIVRKAGLSFISSVLLLGYAFMFLFMKNFSCWKQGLWSLNDPDMNVLLSAQLCLLSYLGFSIIIGLVSLKKIALTLSVIKQEFLVLKLGFTQLSFLRKGR
jgi:hypothetical protein